MLEVVGGRYNLLGEIGRGGMGTVRVAFDPVLQRRVAIKVMHSPLERDEGWLARFQREAQAVARMQHPNVISVYDFGVDDGKPYTVMELLEGEDLETRLTRRRSLPVDVTLQIVSEVARALAAAHAAGIVHCDLKPANIFLSRLGANEVVKVLDFGVAWMTSLKEAPEDGNRRIAGTPAYMSPEQVLRDNLDLRVDLWALAVVAYSCLTGKLPFPQQKLSELFINIQYGSPTPPSAHAPHLTNAFDDFMTRALAKSPADRFASASDFLAAFSAAAERANAAGPAKILVVDDEEDVEQLILSRFRREIRKRQYEMRFATDGLAALDVLKEVPDIDVALVDINMPRMNGLKFLQEVTKLAPFLKVIMVSAYGDMPNVRTAMRSGAFDFVVKPIDTDDLQETMNKALQHVREIKRAFHFAEENQWLRSLLGHSVVDRLLPLTSQTPVTGNEAIQATVVSFRIHDVDALGTGIDIQNVVRTMTDCLEIIAARMAPMGGAVEQSANNSIVMSFQGEEHATRSLEMCLRISGDLLRLLPLDRQGRPGARGIGMGLSTGPVAYVAIGSGVMGRPERRLVGAPVSTAEFLGACAGHGDILICGRMHELIASRVQTEKRTLQSDLVSDGRIEAYHVRGKTENSPSNMDTTVPPESASTIARKTTDLV